MGLEVGHRARFGGDFGTGGAGDGIPGRFGGGLTEGGRRNWRWNRAVEGTVDGTEEGTGDGTVEREPERGLGRGVRV